MRSDGNHGEHEAFSRPVISGCGGWRGGLKTCFFSFHGRKYRPRLRRQSAEPTVRLISSHPQPVVGRGAQRGARIHGRPRLLKPEVYGRPAKPVVHMRRSDPDGM